MRRILTKEHAAICKIITLNPPSFRSHLHSAGFISAATYENVTSTTCTKAKIAKNLMQDCQGHITTADDSVKNMIVFLEILAEEPAAMPTVNRIKQNVSMHVTSILIINLYFCLFTYSLNSSTGLMKIQNSEQKIMLNSKQAIYICVHKLLAISLM